MVPSIFNTFYFTIYVSFEYFTIIIWAWEIEITESCFWPSHDCHASTLIMLVTLLLRTVLYCVVLCCLQYCELVTTLVWISKIWLMLYCTMSSVCLTENNIGSLQSPCRRTWQYIRWQYISCTTQRILPWLQSEEMSQFMSQVPPTKQGVLWQIWGMTWGFFYCWETRSHHIQGPTPPMSFSVPKINKKLVVWRRRRRRRKSLSVDKCYCKGRG